MHQQNSEVQIVESQSCEKCLENKFGQIHMVVWANQTLYGKQSFSIRRKEGTISSHKIFDKCLKTFIITEIVIERHFLYSLQVHSGNYTK